jgi:hypothetical protein
MDREDIYCTICENSSSCDLKKGDLCRKYYNALEYLESALALIECTVDMLAEGESNEKIMEFMRTYMEKHEMELD